MDLLQIVENWTWIVWLVLALVFLVIEMLTLDLTFLMLSIGALAGLGADLAGAPPWVQVIVAAGLAAALVLTLRPPLLRLLRRGEDVQAFNVDALRGIGGSVLATVSDGTGQVRLANGETWTARTEGAVELEPGTDVQVDRIDGATAYVRPRGKESIE